MTLLQRIYNFYRDGFRSMTVGKKLWLIIFIKLFIMFAILKLFFFPNYLQTNFETDQERGNHVLEQLINKK
jgi:cell division protein FtsL